MPPALHTMTQILQDIEELSAEEQPQPALTLHIGDISYARGWAFFWEWFMQLIQPVAAQTPYMVRWSW